LSGGDMGIFEEMRRVLVVVSSFSLRTESELKGPAEACNPKARPLFIIGPSSSLTVTQIRDFGSLHLKEGIS